MSANGWMDVSLPLFPGMVHWPGEASATRIEQVMAISRGDRYNLTALAMSAHLGTHMDAPLHFVDGGSAIDAMPIEATVGEARVIGIEDPIAVRAAELERHDIRRGERILLKTRNSAALLNKDEFDENYVFVAQDAARHFVERGVRTVGIDYLSIGGYHQDLVETHVILLSAGIWVIEGLDLSGVEPGRYEMVCLPLKIRGAEGAPARAVLRRL